VTGDRRVLVEQRDQALQDLVDLEDQVAAGELEAAVADRLRDRYESVAARAITALAAAAGPPTATEPPTAPEPPTATGPATAADAHTAADPPTAHRPRRHAGRRPAYALAAAAALVAVLLLPGSVGTRPAGGFVTGNEAVQRASDAAPGPIGDPASVSDSQLEAVVAANPNVLGMRLALADRYLGAGQYAQAGRHLSVALAQQPHSVPAQSHYGWLLMQLGRPEQAIGYVDRALAGSPDDLEALWFLANIALYGLSDPDTAVTALTRLQRRTDLTPASRDQVAALLQSARERTGGR